MKTDIEYIEAGLFISFFPKNDFGECLIRQMIEQTGSNRFFTPFKGAIVDKLKSTGAVVRKARKQKIDTDKLLEELRAG